MLEVIDMPKCEPEVRALEVAGCTLALVEVRYASADRRERKWGGVDHHELDVVLPDGERVTLDLRGFDGDDDFWTELRALRVLVAGEEGMVTQ